MLIHYSLGNLYAARKGLLGHVTDYRAKEEEWFLDGRLRRKSCLLNLKEKFGNDNGKSSKIYIDAVWMEGGTSKLYI